MPSITPEHIARVTDLVRSSGLSAHSAEISTPVLAVALQDSLNPRELQAAVERYADALDAGNDPETARALATSTCWCGQPARFINEATDATPEHAACGAHLKDGWRFIEGEEGSR